MKKFVFIILIYSLLFAFVSTSSARDLLEKAEFATVAQAKEYLLKEDDYLRSLSQFDIDLRVGKQNSTKEELMQILADDFVRWGNREKDIISKILYTFEETLLEEGYNLNFPDTLFFVKSKNEAEIRSEGYTRGKYIVLKDEIFKWQYEIIKNIVIHEIFHVITRYDPQFREDIYAVLGFRMMNELPSPAVIKDFIITNPDALKKDSYITVEFEGEPVDCYMAMFSNREYDGGSFEDYIYLGLVKLRGIMVKEIDINNETPTIYDITKVENFFEQIGYNTDYILDPEEIAAENFVLAINDNKKPATPRISEEIKKVLKMER